MVHTAGTFSAHQSHGRSDRVPVMISAVRSHFTDLSKRMG
jgi:hypothetical protein